MTRLSRASDAIARPSSIKSTRRSGRLTRRSPWLDDSLDAEYLTQEEFAELDQRYDAIGGMLSRMIDRADDFCKNAPDTDYRFREDSPFTDH